MTNPFRKIRVTEGEKALDVYIPRTDDRIEARDLEQYAIGKTKDDLRHKEIFNRKKTQVDKKEAAGILKEARDFADRKAAGTKRFY